MLTRIVLLLVVAPELVVAQNVELSSLPEPIAAFCAQVLKGDIAAQGKRFNATDVINRDVPTRRIIAFKTIGETSYLWYEHGGLGYHQHLVGFNNARPKEILESYSLIIKPVDRSIEDVIADKATLNPYDVEL